MNNSKFYIIKKHFSINEKEAPWDVEHSIKVSLLPGIWLAIILCPKGAYLVTFFGNFVMLEWENNDFCYLVGLLSVPIIHDKSETFFIY